MRKLPVPVESRSPIGRSGTDRSHMASAMALNKVTTNLDRIRPQLEDGILDDLRKVFFATGRGARKKITNLHFNKKLMLQVFLLKESAKEHKTWEECGEFLQKFCEPQPLFKLRNLLKRTLKELEELDKLDTGLTTFLHTPVLPQLELGPFCADVGLTTDQLGSPDFSTICSAPTNGLVLELEEHRKKKSLPFHALHTWMCKLTKSDLTLRSIRQRVDKSRKKYKEKQKVCGPAGESGMHAFLNEHFLLPEPAAEVLISSTTTALDSMQKGPVRLVQQLGNKEMQLAAARREIKKQTLQIASTMTALSDLKEEWNKSHEEDTMIQLQESEKISTLKSSFREKEEENRNLKGKLKKYSKGTVKRNLKRTEEKLVQTLNENVRLEEKQMLVRVQCVSWKQKCRKQQLQIANLKRSLKRANNETNQRRADPEPEDPQGYLEENYPILRLKDEAGHFKPEAKICVMALVGECEVSSERCGSVIQTVVRQLTGARLPDSDLPSQRSALRFADQGHVISQSHVAETLMESSHWDLHTDGTGRSGVKYVGQQVTADEQTLSVGFAPVGSEDATTLLDITIQMLEDLADLYAEGEAQEKFVHMLHGLSGVMSDRAAVMNAFGRKLQDERRVLLNTDEGLDFLHCNAHFLLGMANECKKTLRSLENDGGERLGRDGMAAFNRFVSSECSAFRYIRTACDCLGPRGDDKNGCRETWVAYCALEEKRSSITSFRSNRFNNVFQAAGALHFHQHDVQTCLSSCLDKKNKKLKSVLADSQSEVIDSYLIALGLLYYRVTGPYWSLLMASVHYLDFYVHVERLHGLLQEWEQDASSAFDQEVQPLFPGIQFQGDAGIFQSLLAISEEKKAGVKAVLQSLCQSLVVVTQRQLADFLPDGKYHQVQNQDLREKLQHSHITNIVSEECFADLDFSLFKRRHASVHHHSTVNMPKRNKSITSWLEKKNVEQQHQLLSLSAKKAQSLRQKHLQVEKDTVHQRKEHIIQLRQKKQDALQKKQQKVAGLMEDLRHHQGPCTIVTDVDHLLTIYTNHRDLQKACRAEILFQKLVMLRTEAELKVTGRVLTLVNRLRLFFGGQALERLPPIQAPRDHHQPARKRPRVLFEDEVEEDSEDLGRRRGN